MIPNLNPVGLIIDCANPGRVRDFYAALLGLEKTVAYGRPAFKVETGFTVLFAETEVPYIPPVWPEVPGAQQKQMHLDFVVDDLPSAVEDANRLGAAKPAEQYGDHYVTLLDPDGHPFCLCARSNEKSSFDMYYETKGWGPIPDLSIMVDCQKSKNIRDFYARLKNWDRDFHGSVLIPANKMIICFQESEGDYDYVPPVWPEASGAQQKQMQFIIKTDDLRSAVDEAARFGAVIADAQYDGEYFVTMIDTEGHPFCLCDK